MTFPAVAAAIRESLYVDRLLSTRQIHQLHTPDASLRYVQRVLDGLARRGMVEYVVARRRAAQHLWFLSERGAEIVEATAGERMGRRAQVTFGGADGDLQAHTLEVNDVGVAFVRASRRHGDDCGPLSWRHEVSHAIGERPGTGETEFIRADAVLRYTRYAGGGAELRSWFVELDRSTESTGALLEKLHRYARFRAYRPDGGSGGAAWRFEYPLGFPEILVVFAGNKPRSALQRRMRLVSGFARQQHAQLAGINVACTLLEDLVEHGPFAPIWVRSRAGNQLFAADDAGAAEERLAA